VVKGFNGFFLWQKKTITLSKSYDRKIFVVIIQKNYIFVWTLY